MNKALRKTEFSELFLFASFGIVQFLKFGTFWKNPVFLNSQKFCGKSSEISLGQKNPVFEAKTGVLGSNTGFSEYSEVTKYSEFVLFRIFQK